jgi:hypothetical protein
MPFEAARVSGNAERALDVLLIGWLVNKPVEPQDLLPRSRGANRVPREHRKVGRELGSTHDRKSGSNTPERVWLPG